MEKGSDCFLVASLFAYVDAFAVVVVPQLQYSALLTGLRPCLATGYRPVDQPEVSSTQSSLPPLRHRLLFR